MKIKMTLTQFSTFGDDENFPFFFSLSLGRWCFLATRTNFYSVLKKKLCWWKYCMYFEGQFIQIRACSWNQPATYGCSRWQMCEMKTTWNFFYVPVMCTLFITINACFLWIYNAGWARSISRQFIGEISCQKAWC